MDGHFSFELHATANGQIRRIALAWSHHDIDNEILGLAILAVDGQLNTIRKVTGTLLVLLHTCCAIDGCADFQFYYFDHNCNYLKTKKHSKMVTHSAPYPVRC